MVLNATLSRMVKRRILQPCAKFNAHFQHDGQGGLDIWIDILSPELLSLLQNEVASERTGRKAVLVGKRYWEEAGD